MKKISQDCIFQIRKHVEIIFDLYFEETLEILLEKKSVIINNQYIKVYLCCNI